MNLETLKQDWDALGIPYECFDLSFDYLAKGELLSVAQQFKLDNPKLENYLMIGTNGSGDPIAIEKENDALVYLNHDDNWAEIFINSSLAVFAAYVEKIDAFQDGMKALTPDALFETEFSDDDFENLMGDLIQIDGLALVLAPNSHWWMVIENFKWEREEGRNEAGEK